MTTSPLINADNSHTGSFLFSNTVVPNGPHTLPPAAGKVESAAGIYPDGGTSLRGGTSLKGSGLKGGTKRRRSLKSRSRRSLRSRINKISRRYKMKGSKRKSLKSLLKGLKGRRTGRRTKRHGRKGRHTRSRRHTRSKRGGSSLMPNYPPGHAQYQNNNGSVSNTFSTGGPLPANLSALATPPPYQNVAGDVDNLNHNALNAYGNSGAGAGFASRGWF